MFNREKPTSESLEKEKIPEQIVSSAISAIEDKDATDSVISSEWVDKAKKFTKASGIMAGVSLVLSLILSGKMLYGLYGFAKKAIEKKGQVGFEEGSKIGEEIFSFGSEKDKK
mgnify:CR=1 FL=1